jgi:hypothetical protein
MPDLSTVGGPALSATTDSPVPSPAPAPAPAPSPEPSPTPAPAPTEAPKVEDDKATAPTPTPAPTEAPKVEDDKGEKEKTGIEKRFSEYAQKVKAEKERADAAETNAKKLADDLQAAIKRLDEAGQQREAERLQAEAAADKKPDRSAFDDAESYDKALADWGVREGKRQAAADMQKQAAEEKVKAEEEAKQRAEQEQREAAEKAWTDTVQAHQDRAAKFKEVTPDYDEVINSAGEVPMTVPMRDAILSSEFGPQVAYHLAKNPEESARITALSPFQQVMEMGRLAERFSKPKSNVSRAPAPVTPVGSSGNAGPPDVNAMSGDQYYEHRMSQMKGRRT